ncbi:MAG: flagellar hook-associated protein 3 [Hydrogenophilales bacterium CG_4_9_14_3_um_filter_59_35]|nr:MAG: flagellar hook-associated protein 3 [Hydrogenophilales bacterium CG18_big_fil_WC_8_21_14_2_50_58_12]PIY00207.1 MAG: flagellar hook-associated protein 3 [Hydrogenophilales bacterium CG_4_10_14_3_um_filter_58_23]PJB06064.1 MAG: flagellar hook-associated protein 3 [Hydrogenophilales bacterium CG_4_9_14_3_um_filter_59_35]
MRISTNTMYDMGVAGMQQATSDLIRTQQQVSSGRRILTPSDDPVASARVLDLTQSQSINKQYDTNTGSATSSLGMEESTLASVGNLIQSMQTTAVYAGNGTLNNSDRASLATELRANYQELLGLANNTDGNGQYLFSGYKGVTKPFVETSLGNVTYQGDQGQRLIQISPSRQMAVSDSGSSVFQQIKNGNGTIVGAAAAANTGAGIIDPATVTNLADANLRQPVSIVFNNPPTTFSVTGTGTGNPVNVPYTSGSTISYNGWSMNITGAPQPGDTFTVQPSSNVDIFKTLGDFIAQLETPIQGGGTGAAAKLTNNINTALQNFGQSLQNVLTVRTSVGTRMNEVDSVKSAGEDLQLQYQQTISSLQDMDYAQAITDLTRQKASLEAAQLSFTKIQSLSLFNYIQ